MNNTKYINLSNTNDNFDTWIKDLNPDNQKILYEKDILILPELNYGQTEGASYHEEVIDFIDYLDEKNENLKYGFCSDNEKILSLNNNDIWLGAFLIYAPQLKTTTLNIFINLLSSYLYDRFIKFGKNPNVKCKFKVVKEKDKVSKTLEYDGDAETLREIAPNIIESFNNAE